MSKYSMNCNFYLTISSPGESTECLELQAMFCAVFSHIDADLSLGPSGPGAIVTSPFQPGTSLLKLALHRPFLHTVLVSREKLEKPSQATTNGHLPAINLHTVWRLINFCLLNRKY